MNLEFLINLYIFIYIFFIEGSYYIFNQQQLIGAIL